MFWQKLIHSVSDSESDDASVASDEEPAAESDDDSDPPGLLEGSDSDSQERPQEGDASDSDTASDDDSDCIKSFGDMVAAATGLSRTCSFTKHGVQKPEPKVKSKRRRGEAMVDSLRGEKPKHEARADSLRGEKPKHEATVAANRAVQLANARTLSVSKHYRNVQDRRLQNLDAMVKAVVHGHGSNIRCQRQARVVNIKGRPNGGKKRKASRMLDNVEELAVVCGSSKRVRSELAIQISQSGVVKKPDVPPGMQYNIAFDECLLCRNQLSKVWNVAASSVSRYKNSAALSILDTQENALLAITKYFARTPCQMISCKESLNHNLKHTKNEGMHPSEKMCGKIISNICSSFLPWCRLFRLDDLNVRF